MKSKVAKMCSYKDDVRRILESDDIYKNSDEKLVARYYYNLLGNDINSINAMDILTMIAKKQIPLPDYITRVRRKLQEDYPELRGVVWYERHKLKEEVIREIKYL